MNNTKIVAVILCGGSGTRLWPASRETFPKQFLSLMGEKSLLQETMTRSIRTAKIAASDIVTVTLGLLKSEVVQQLSAIDPAAAVHVLSEPSARNTAAAVALAAEYVKNTFGEDALMWVLPADHHIGDEDALAQSLAHGIDAARNGHMVTFGIQPTRPETGYGYIRAGLASDNGQIHAVEQFVEKPDLQTAITYVQSGKYLWNSGMFLFTAQAVLAQFSQHASGILKTVRDAMTHGADNTPAADIYATIEDQPFDKAIMERTPLVSVVPCNPSWSDIGSWESLWELRAKDEHGNVVQGHAICHDTRNCLVTAQDRLIACAGVEDIVVIETADALLIANRKNSDSMKALVKSLKAAGASEVRDAPGKKVSTTVTSTGDGYSTREINLASRQAMTFNAHALDNLFWTVLEGEGHALIGADNTVLHSGNTVFIPANTPYKLTASGKSGLKIVEVGRSTAEADGFARYDTQQRAA